MNSNQKCLAFFRTYLPVCHQTAALFRIAHGKINRYIQSYIMIVIDFSIIICDSCEREWGAFRANHDNSQTTPCDTIAGWSPHRALGPENCKFEATFLSTRNEPGRRNHCGVQETHRHCWTPRPHRGACRPTRQFAGSTHCSQGSSFEFAFNCFAAVSIELA
jgi:hypothetical protein